MEPNAAQFCNVVQSFGDALESVQDLVIGAVSQLKSEIFSSNLVYIEFYIY
jgi:hypothetical protein